MGNNTTKFMTLGLALYLVVGLFWFFIKPTLFNRKERLKQRYIRYAVEAFSTFIAIYHQICSNTTISVDGLNDLIDKGIKGVHSFIDFYVEGNSHYDIRDIFKAIPPEYLGCIVAHNILTDLEYDIEDDNNENSEEEL